MAGGVSDSVSAGAQAGSMLPVSSQKLNLWHNGGRLPFCSEAWCSCDVMVVVVLRLGAPSARPAHRTVPCSTAVPVLCTVSAPCASLTPPRLPRQVEEDPDCCLPRPRVPQLCHHRYCAPARRAAALLPRQLCAGGSAWGLVQSRAGAGAKHAALRQVLSAPSADLRSS